MRILAPVEYWGVKFNCIYLFSMPCEGRVIEGRLCWVACGFGALCSNWQGWFFWVRWSWGGEWASEPVDFVTERTSMPPSCKVLSTTKLLSILDEWLLSVFFSLQLGLTCWLYKSICGPREMAQWLRAASLLLGVRICISAPMSGGTRLPITPPPGDLVPTSGLYTYGRCLHRCAHTYTHKGF